MYAGAVQLRRQLVLLGDLSGSTASSAAESQIIDTALAQSLARFQWRHRLPADGVEERWLH